jgi:alkaline phosphatase isozyme conversion protein
MKRRSKLLSILLISVMFLSACGGTESTSDSAPTSEPATQAPTEEAATQSPEAGSASSNSDYGLVAREHLTELADEIGTRIPGSPEEAQAAAYVEAAFQEYGYEVETQTFSFVTEDGEELESANIIAVKAGASTQEIVIGAHYDSGDEADGADDNASGVAVMLEVAKMLQETAPRYTVRFVAFGAEENDLNGSRYFVSQMDTDKIENTIGMVNLDSLVAGDFAYIYGDTETGGMWDWVIQHAKSTGFALDSRTAADMDENGVPCDCADYGPFQEAGIHFAYFEATDWNLGAKDGMTQVDPSLGDGGDVRHTEFDTIAYIDSTFPRAH